MRDSETAREIARKEQRERDGVREVGRKKEGIFVRLCFGIGSDFRAFSNLSVNLR